MAAIIVALGVAGLWLLMDEEPQPQGSKPVSTSPSVSTASRPARAASHRPAPSPQTRPEKPPEGVLAVEVLSKNQPLPGAQVQIYEREPANLSVFPAQWFGRASGTTGANGRWELPIASGTYYVTARADGLAPAYASVVLPPGSSRTGVQLRLEEGMELVGSTLDKATGDPVPLAEILLTPPAFSSGTRDRADAPEEEGLVAMSNEAGEFRFSGLAPGRYRLEARAPGYTSAVLPSVPIPFKGRVTLLMIPGGQLEGTVLGANGQPAAEAEVFAVGREHDLSVLSNSEGHFSLEVPPGAYAVSARKGPEVGALEGELKVSVGQRVQGLRLQLGEGAWLSGKVVRRDGSPVLGARVEAWPRGLSTASSQAVTGEGGSFSLPPLAAGTYTLQVFIPKGYFLIPEGFQFAHAPVTLAAGEHASLTLTFNSEPGNSLRCLVRDASKHPVGDVQLRASLLQPQATSAPQAFEGHTDARGLFIFTGLPTGLYRVEALRDGRSLSTPLSLFVPQNQGGCYFPNVPSETAPEGLSATVEGQILQRSGAPLDEALQVELSDREHRSLYQGSRGRILVDAQGRFRLTVSPGSYTLKAFRQRAAGCEAAGQREFQVEAGQHLETTLLLGETREPDLRLRVLEANGAPATRTAVRVYPSESFFSGLALTDGQARLDVCLPPEKEQPPSARLVTVSSLDGARAAQVEAVSGLGELPVQLRPLPVVQGRILQPLGLPVRHVRLDIFPTGLWTPYTYEFVGDQFELPQFPLGRTQLLVDADGFKASITVESQPEEHKVLEIPVYPGVSATGRLVDAATRRPVDLMIATGAHLSQRTGPDGRFSFQNVAVGDLWLQIDRRPPFRVQLSPAQANDLGDITVPMP